MLAIETAYAEQQKTTPANFLLYLMHLKTYQFALPYCNGGRVLDVGCGPGYGVCRIAPNCREVIGIDTDADIIKYARENFTLDNTEFRVVRPAEEEPFPFENDSFDTVISFQVIEHVFDMNAYLSEIRRVLKPNGIFVCATPDRTTRLFPYQRPWNFEHVTEFSKQDFESVLKSQFDEFDIFKMGGNPDVIRIEIERTKKLRRLLLPVTLPIIPDALRVHALRMAQNLKNESSQGADSGLNFDLDDIHISKEASPSLNLISVARA
jgi:SAM-dependent methyltransferase